MSAEKTITYSDYVEEVRRCLIENCKPARDEVGFETDYNAIEMYQHAGSLHELLRIARESSWVLEDLATVLLPCGIGSPNTFHTSEVCMELMYILTQQVTGWPDGEFRKAAWELGKEGWDT